MYSFLFIKLEHRFSVKAIVEYFKYFMSLNYELSMSFFRQSVEINLLLFSIIKIYRLLRV